MFQCFNDCRNTKEDFDKFVVEFNGLSNYSSYNGYSGSYNYSAFDDYGEDPGEWSNQTGRHDDFFLETGAYSKQESADTSLPITPSNKFHCHHGWVCIRSELSRQMLYCFDSY